MRTISEVDPDKLRGGFYSPPELVKVCLDRIRELLPEVSKPKVLEPSIGDGAFLRGLASHPLSERVTSLVGVELVESEAAKAEEAGANFSFPIRIRTGSFLDPSLISDCDFDAAIGNPPFVRFQFVPNIERFQVETLGLELGIEFRGVSNLWIPIFLRAVSRLRQGGAFAFIIPAEFLTGVSAAVVRKWLLVNTQRLRIDLFPPGSFPGVLQEIVVISGISARGASKTLTICEHGSSYRCWRHEASRDEPTWTRYLLTPEQLSSLQAASHLSHAKLLGEVARFAVSTVTGANEFFSVDSATVDKYGLSHWARPLLPRIRNAKGITFSEIDQKENEAAGTRAFLLDFSAERPDPTLHPRAAQYIQIGESQGLHERYKCRIRVPWHRVPVVKPGELLLSKRSHLYPRVVKNAISALTTDTIYQGSLLPAFKGTRDAFVAAFHNSLTLLSAEIEGRSFGGGVLELVPSEVARLRVFVAPEMASYLGKLDSIARSINPDKDDTLIEETDRYLSEIVPGLTNQILSTISEARYELLQRRLDRNRVS